MPRPCRSEILDPNRVDLVLVTNKVSRGRFLLGRTDQEPEQRGKKQALAKRLDSVGDQLKSQLREDSNLDEESSHYIFEAIDHLITEAMQEESEDFSHRRLWIIDRLRQYAKHFGIDVLGFVVMSNHYHLVLRTRPDVVADLSDTEVARRVCLISPNKRTPDGEPCEPTESELDLIRNNPQELAEARRKLSDVSALMRRLNQFVATRANREEDKHGHFWKERYHSVRLVDDAALLAATLYVDMNPIRAFIAQTLEECEYSSLQRRLVEMLTEYKQAMDHLEWTDRCRRGWLPSDLWGGQGPKGPSAFLSPLSVNEAAGQTGPMTSTEYPRCSDKGFLPLTVEEYFDLLEHTAQLLQGLSPQPMPGKIVGLFTRLGVNEAGWKQLMEQFPKLFPRIAGTSDSRSEMIGYRSGAQLTVSAQAVALLSGSD